MTTKLLYTWKRRANQLKMETYAVFLRLTVGVIVMVKWGRRVTQAVVRVDGVRA